MAEFKTKSKQRGGEAMTETENLVLEHLRAIRADVAALREEVGDVKRRLGNLELQSARSGEQIAHLQVMLAEQSVRADRVDAKLGRIERRLDLADAQT
jgi:uncharacterized coiled-coil protein SlyX